MLPSVKSGSLRFHFHLSCIVKTAIVTLQKAIINRIVPHPRVLNYAQKFRYLIFRGPFQKSFVEYYRRKSITPNTALPPPSIFPDLNVERTLTELNENGYSIAFQLQQSHIEQLLETIISSGSDSIRELHKHCECFERIARDYSVMSVARQYLGVEPVIYASSIYLTAPLAPVRKTSNKPMKTVHFDANDFRDLNLFIYLNDVDDDASPHYVFEGTHKKKTYRDLFTRWYTRDEITARFGPKIKSITGPAGLAFFEDTSAFHIQSRGKRARYTMSVCFTLQRSPNLARHNA